MADRQRKLARGMLRWLGRLLLLAALLLVFSAAALAGLLLHIDLPATRRLAARTLTTVLSDFFYGRLSIGAFTHLSLDEVSAQNVVVHDTEGKQVLSVSQLRAKADVAGIAQQLVWGKPKETLVIRHIRLEQVECELIPDETISAPSLVRALTPAPKPRRRPRRPKTPRHIRVWMPTIEIGKAWGRGTLGELPTLEAQLSGVKGSVLATPKGAAIDVRRFGAVVRGLGGTDAMGTGDLHIRVPGPIWTSFDGHFGDVQVGTFVRVDGKQITATVDLPRAQAEAVRALWPDWPLKDDLRAHVEVTGEVSRLQTSGQFEVGGARVRASGPLHLTGDVGAQLDVQAEHVDLRSVVADAPATDLSADTALSVWQRGERLVVDVNATSQPTTVAGLDVPAVDLKGTYDEKGFSGKATFHERGMPVKVTFVVRPAGAIDLEAQASTFRIQQAPRLAQHTDADARADVRVKAHIDKSQLSATLSADLSDVRAGELQMQRGRLTSTLQGPLAEPLDWNVDAQLSAANLAAGGFGFEQVNARARGSARQAHVTAALKDTFGPNVNASGLVLPLSGRVQDLKLAVSRGGVTIDGKVSRLDLDQSNVEIRDLNVSGAGGTLQGTVRLRPNLLHVDARGEDLDLDAISRALGLPRGTLGGRLSFSADVTTSEELSRGRVRLALGDGTVASFGGITASVHADLNRDRFEGNASVILADRGVFGTTWDTTLAGPPLQAESWRDILGELEVYFGKVNLMGAEQLLPASARIQRIDGSAFGQVRLEREDRTAFPSLYAVVGTKELVVTRAPAEDDPSGETALKVQNIDVQLGTSIDGENGGTRATIRLIHSREVLATATATTHLDLQRLVDEPATRGAQLLSTPLDAVLTIPERPFADFPEQLAVEGLSGTVSGRMTLRGTLSDPILNATARVRGFKPEQSRLALPVDLTLAAQYERSTGRFGADGEISSDGRRVALLTARGSAQWEDLLAERAGPEPRWQGEAKLLLQGTPLEVLPPFADRQIGGTLQGTVQLSYQGKLPRLSTRLSVEDASVENIPIGDGSLRVHSDGRRISGELSFAHEGRILSASGQGWLAWTGGWPTLDEKRPTVVDLKAARFDAIVLQPLLSGALSKLSGEIDAELKAEVSQRADPDQEGETRYAGRISGRAHLRKGVVQLAGLGLTLHDVRMKAVARHAGENTIIEITELRGRARSQKHNLKAHGTLYLDGWRFGHGQAWVQTVEEDIPLLVEGVTLATASGRANAYLQRQDDRMLVEVKVPKLSAKLPSSSERELIEVKDNDDIEVTQLMREPEEPRSGSALPWHVVINLGKQVRVQRHDMYIPITGQPVIDLEEETEITGYIDLEPGGRLHALGKLFVVKTGRLRFDTGENSNPHIDVTAAWQAPEATVYMDIHGTLRDAEVSWRSDPPRPEHEVVALLLSGETASTDETQEGSQAYGVASHASAEILDKIFADTPLSDIKFRASAAEGKPSYTAAYRISDQVWLEGIYRPESGLSEEGGASEESDLTEQGRHDAFAGAIDYRFSRDWSLRTEAGNASASVGILWQYRY